MTDRELIIDALRDYEGKRERWASLAGRESRGRDAKIQQACADQARRVRAELEDNPDYVVKGSDA